VDEQRSTRRLRIVKYRGTTHGTNEYPFLIDEDGICVMPITKLRLEHKVYRGRISTGVEALDGMLSGGYYRGTSVLVSGNGRHRQDQPRVPVRGERLRPGRALPFLRVRGVPAQLQRNMRSIGIDFAPYVAKGLLRFHAARRRMHGIEMHLATMIKACRDSSRRWSWWTRSAP
jgi:circadian clock protein KaiC